MYWFSIKLQNVIKNRIHFNAFGGGGGAYIRGGGCLILGCIFCSLVGGPWRGEGEGLTSGGLRSLGLVNNYRNALISF